jgi:hypothetical protein
MVLPAGRSHTALPNLIGAVTRAFTGHCECRGHRHSLRMRLVALAERLPILCPRLLHRGARLDEATRRPVGDNFWLTVVSPESPDGPELLLEPSDHPAVKPYRDALVEDGIPLASFAVDDVEAAHARLTATVWYSRSRRPTSAPLSWPSLMTHAATSFSSSKRSRTRTTTTPAEGQHRNQHSAGNLSCLVRLFDRTRMPIQATGPDLVGASSSGTAFSQAK